jgi:class 3 adenylate cyclase
MPLNARESVCGKCGYIVKGLTTLTCPECGSDLRDVGIISPDHPRERSRLTQYIWRTALILGWTGLCVAIYVIFFIPYREVIFGPLQQTCALVDRNLWPYRGFCRRTVSLVPASGAFGKITLTENMIARTSGSFDLYFVRIFDGYNTNNLTRWDIDADMQTLKGAHRHLIIDVLHGMTCRIEDEREVLAGNEVLLDRKRVLDWLRDAGVDVTGPQVQREAAAVLEIVKTSATSDYINAAWGSDETAPVGRLERIVLRLQQRTPMGTPRSWSDRSGAEQEEFGPIFHINWVGIPFSLLLWAGGMRFLVRRIRGVRGAKKEGPAPTGSRTMSIMFTDMVGYTARASLESRGGLLELVRRKRELVQGVLERRHGRIVKTLGDGLLIAFDSATDAVLAGVEIQEVLARQNQAAADEREKFELRIAISTGEVAQADNDIYGEPVNLASRVQQLAQPGEVYLTETTFATLNKAEAPSEKLGEFEVKGVAGMVTLYRATPANR